MYSIFFALLNPQPNGAGFAGVKTNLTLDLGEAGAQSEGFIVQCRAQVSWRLKIFLQYTHFDKLFSVGKSELLENCSD